jgi:hypothetical protein
MTRPLCRLGTSIGIALALSACAGSASQAPLSQAKKLDVATNGISSACGEAYQVTAFAGEHTRQLKSLSATATQDARKLAGVDRHNSRWVYQGQTVAEIVQDSISTLSSCGLKTAASPLVRIRG